MSGAMPDDDENAVRYCKPRTLDVCGTPIHTAFRLRRGEDYLSVNWLGFFGKSGPGDAVEKVRRALRSKRFHTSPNGRFFVLDVLAIKAAGNRKSVDLRVERRPSLDDESHAGIFGYTAAHTEVAAELARAAKRIGLSYRGIA